MTLLFSLKIPLSIQLRSKEYLQRWFERLLLISQTHSGSRSLWRGLKVSVGDDVKKLRPNRRATPRSFLARDNVTVSPNIKPDLFIAHERNFSDGPLPLASPSCSHSSPTILLKVCVLSVFTHAKAGTSAPCFIAFSRLDGSPHRPAWVRCV